MANMTYADLFTGLGGASIGAMQAGLTPIWGVEIDSKISYFAGLNIRQHFERHYIFTKDINDIPVQAYEKCGLTDFERPDWIHASPPCINASRAKNGKETQYDVELADAICRAIAVLSPDYFSLENVAGYAEFDSFRNVQKLLNKLDYYWTWAIFNCEDYGIPQSRKRLFLMASKHGGSRSRLYRQQPVSWYEAIADLIPTLKPTTLTNWQIAAINSKYSYILPSRFGCIPQSFNFVIQRSGARKKDGIPNNTIRIANEPMFTVKAMSGNIRTSVNQVTIVIDGQPYEADTRCLARWQSIPDWYQFSGDLKLDTKIIGNAVPPLMMQKIIEAVLK